jgi:DNA primase
MNVEEYVRSKFKHVNISGKSLQVPCIYHHDHGKGHLYIYPDSGFFRCFHASCDERGNFKKLLRDLGDRDIIDSIELDDSKYKKRRITNAVHTLPESIVDAYTQFIPVDLLNSGFSLDILKKKQIGFDKANYRVTFPIRDKDGTLVGIGGRRVFDDQGSRYKFYVEDFQNIAPGYEFLKGEFLYNLDEVYSRAYFDDCKEIIVVEGFKACLWLLQHGYWNTVALMGATISDAQVDILTSLTNKFILFLDNDEGGFRQLLGTGQEKTVADKLLNKGTVRIVLGDKKQPDEYNKEELEKLFSSSISPMTLKLKIKEISNE